MLILFQRAAQNKGYHAVECRTGKSMPLLLIPVLFSEFRYEENKPNHDEKGNIKFIDHLLFHRIIGTRN